MLETRIAFFLWLGAALLATGHAFAADVVPTASERPRCALHNAMVQVLAPRHGESRQPPDFRSAMR